MVSLGSFTGTASTQHHAKIPSPSTTESLLWDTAPTKMGVTIGLLKTAGEGIGAKPATLSWGGMWVVSRGRLVMYIDASFEADIEGGRLIDVPTTCTLCCMMYCSFANKDERQHKIDKTIQNFCQAV